MCCRTLTLLVAVAATVSLLSPAVALQRPPQVWVGVGIQAEKDIPSIAGLTAKSGLRITSLRFGSPAEKAGLLIDDLIVGAEGHDFSGEASNLENQLRRLILQHMPGDSVTLRIVRDHKVMDIRLQVERTPEPSPVKQTSSPKLD